MSEDELVYNVPLAEAEAVFRSDAEGWFSVGFHPWRPDDYSADRMESLRLWAEDRRMVAIGECGLDKNVKTDLKRQIEVFGEQVALSEEREKPVVVHCVGCFNELFDLKKLWKPKQTWIIHGFRGKPQLAEQALKAGCRLSFGERFNAESVRATPLDSLFVETDESRLPIGEIYKRIAEAKACAVNELTAGEALLKSVRQARKKQLPLQ